ncbi:hypothetical protein JaAD80_27780 [Janthinobacterium sp. AD80]|nr:hypothetical protein JaAD80_27780 [Janthinobacterium sp. AD80]
MAPLARCSEQRAASCIGSMASEGTLCATARNSAAVRAGVPFSSVPSSTRTTSARSSPEAGTELGPFRRSMALMTRSSSSMRARYCSIAW